MRMSLVDIEESVRLQSAAIAMKGHKAIFCLMSSSHYLELIDASQRLVRVYEIDYLYGCAIVVSPFHEGEPLVLTAPAVPWDNLWIKT
jgi:hypothetical protein